MIKAVIEKIEHLIDYTLEFSPSSKKYILSLENKTVYVNCTDLPYHFLLKFLNHKIQLNPVRKNSDSLAILSNSQLKGPSVAFINFLLNKNITKASKLGLTIQGDLETNYALQGFFTNLNVDWEDVIAQWIGDISAHQIGNFFRSSRTWMKKFRYSFQRNLKDYIQEEISLAPTQFEMNDFLENVTKLYLDVERFEKKLELTLIEK